MSKRFIDTNLFSDEWFMDLSKDGKLLWLYLITNCDHAGLISINAKLCRFQTGIKSLETTYKELGNRLVTISKGFIFIPKFITFQYPNFPYSKVRAQVSAINRLKEFNLFDEDTETLTKGLTNSYGNVHGNDNGLGNEQKGISKAKFKPPTENEVIEYFKEKGYKISAAKKAFEFYNVANWIDSKGNKVKNWKQKMISIWMKDEDKVNPNEVNLPRPDKSKMHPENLKYLHDNHLT